MSNQLNSARYLSSGDNYLYGRVTEGSSKPLQLPQVRRPSTNMLNKSSFSSLLQAAQKELSSLGIPAATAGNGESISGTPFMDADLPFLPAELWTEPWLEHSPDLLCVAGTKLVAERLKLEHTPFSSNEARIVALLMVPSLELAVPERCTLFASALSAETTPPPKSTPEGASHDAALSGEDAAPSGEDAARPLSSPTPQAKLPPSAPLTVWSVEPRADTHAPPVRLPVSSKTAADGQRVAQVTRAFIAALEHLQSEMPLTTAAVAPRGVASFRRSSALLDLSALDALNHQEAVREYWARMADDAADARAANSGPATSLVAELRGPAFDRACARLLSLKTSQRGAIFDGLYGVPRVGELATLIVRKHFIPAGSTAEDGLRDALAAPSFFDGQTLDIATAVSTLNKALDDAEESGVTIDALKTLTVIDAQIARSSHLNVPVFTAGGEPVLWSIWASGRAAAAATRGTNKVTMSEVYSIVDELTNFGVAQSRHSSARDQAVASGQGLGRAGLTGLERPSSDSGVAVHQFQGALAYREACVERGCDEALAPRWRASANKATRNPASRSASSATCSRAKPATPATGRGQAAAHGRSLLSGAPRRPR